MDISIPVNKKYKFSILFLSVLFFIFSACSDSSVEPDDINITPLFTNVKIDINPNNTLSAIVKVQVKNATQAYIQFGTDSLFTQRSPSFPIVQDEVEIPLLGLLENTLYSIQVIAISGSGHQTKSDTTYFTSGNLPVEIPTLIVWTNQNPTDGYVLLGLISTVPNSKGFAVIINNDGKVVWYREFLSPVVDFQKQPNGNYTVFSSIDGSPSHFYEVNNLGEIIREFEASNGQITDPHEIRLVEGGYCIFNVVFREMDLTSLGGWPNAQVRGTEIEFIRSNGNDFFWSPFDYFSVTDAAPDIALNTQNVNPWHGNAIEIDNDGNLLASFRNSDVITKINSTTGDIIWRLGGKNNEFTFLNDPLNGFSHQHGIRRLDNGNIILFDNGNLHPQPESRAVEYQLNEQAKTAELVWEYRHNPLLFGDALGFAQRLSNGNTLIDFGTAHRIVEVDHSGIKQWEISVQDSSHYIYRAFRVSSIY